MKRIFIILTIVINALGIYFWLIYSPEQNIYSEEIIQKVAKELDKNLDVLFQEVDSRVKAIENEYQHSPMSNESCNNYFLETFDRHSYIQSLLFFKNQHKYVMVRENSSVISAYDSTKTADIVKWTRFENKKKISEWDEVFDKKKFNLEWINNLKRNSGEYQWIHHYMSLEKKHTLLLGKTWQSNNDEYSLVIRFSRDKVQKSFKAINQFGRFSILLQTTQGKMLDLASNNVTVGDSMLINKELIVTLKTGIKKFDTEDDRVFSYVYNDELYWAAVKSLNPILAIDKIIITIPQASISLNSKKKETYGWLYYSLLLLVNIITVIIVYRKSISVPQFMIGNKKDISIDTILKDNENRHLEFKSSLRWDYRQEKVNPDLEFVIIKTIAAFGNSDGGILLIGVDDDKNILGLENDYNTLKKKDADFYEIYMRNLFHKYFGVKYTTENIRMDFIKDSAKEVCLIEVFKADEPLFLKTKDKSGQLTEKFYVRSGNSSQQIDSLKDINDYIFDRFKKEK